MDIEKAALVSVYDKKNIENLCKGLLDGGYRVYATEGSFSYLEGKGIKVENIEILTGKSQLLGGRVKTLHKEIFCSILAKDKEELKDLNLPQIEIIVVNLYPFKEALKSKNQEIILENIDIGGHAIIRAGIKNYKRICVLTLPEQYDEFLNFLKEGKIDENYRLKLAKEAIEYITYYDFLIGNYFLGGFDNLLYSICKNGFKLKYGENPHQQAFLFESSLPFSVLSDSTLSYNNFLDIESCLFLKKSLEDLIKQRSFCGIIKHNQICGCAIAKTPLEALEKAYQTDPISAYGGVVILDKVDNEVAEFIKNKYFVILASYEFSNDSKITLKEKKNLILIKLEKKQPNNWEFKSITGGILLQEVDKKNLVFEDFEVVVKCCEFDERLKDDCVFAWRVVKTLKSNATVVVKDLKTVGIGSGQTSRIDSVKLALQRAGEAAKDGVLASDGFFPFKDSIEEAAKFGILCVIEPGGSIRDSEVIEEAKKSRINLIFTKIRHFKH